MCPYPPLHAFAFSPVILVKDSYLSHVELDTLSELDNLFVYGYCGTSSIRGNTFIQMDLNMMLGYLSESNLVDTLYPWIIALEIR
jgi:hypothetical protein